MIILEIHAPLSARKVLLATYVGFGQFGFTTGFARVADQPKRRLIPSLFTLNGNS